MAQKWEKTDAFCVLACYNNQHIFQMSSSNQIDLVLVNPNSKKKVYQALSNDLSAIEPPVWAGLMATFVRKKGYSVVIVDAEAEHLSPEETAQRVREIKPRLVAIVVYGHQPSASTQNMAASGLI